MTFEQNTSRRTFVKSLLVAPFISSLIPNHLAVPPSVRKLIPVMVTPFTKNNKIDWKVFDRLTQFYLEAGADGFFANCLSSEMFDLSPEERIKLTERTIKLVKGKLPVVSTGSFGESITEKAEFVKKIYDIGSDAVILVTSHFAGKKDSDSTLITNLEDLLSKTGTIPLGTYESPTPYKRVLTEEVFQFMVDSGRFIYHKDTCENPVAIQKKLQISKGSKLQFYNAHTASGAMSLREGADGMSPISANFYPEILAWLCDNATNPAKKEEVDWIQKELAEAESSISVGYPVGAKYFLQKRGLPIEQIWRVKRNSLTPQMIQGLDDVHARFLIWCDRLDIQPIKI